MKFLIAGLGNIGTEYDYTRHNIGFEILDALAKQLETSFTLGRHAYVAETTYRGKQLWLIKPTTYMNLSGKALQYWIQKEKFDLANTFTIHDDLNIDFGKMRIRAKGSAGGHNGLKSIEETLQTADYPRMRVGIGNQFRQGQQVDFVLGKWSADENPHIPSILKHSTEAILSFVMAGLERTMNLYNNINMLESNS